MGFGFWPTRRAANDHSGNDLVLSVTRRARRLFFVDGGFAFFCKVLPKWLLVLRVPELFHLIFLYRSCDFHTRLSLDVTD